MTKYKNRLAIEYYYKYFMHEKFNKIPFVKIPKIDKSLYKDLGYPAIIFKFISIHWLYFYIMVGIKHIEIINKK